MPILAALVPVVVLLALGIATRLCCIRARSTPPPGRNRGHLKRIAAAADETQAEKFHSFGVKAVVERGNPHGSHTAAVVLAEMGCDTTKVAAWMQQLTARVAAQATGSAAVAA